MQAAGKFDGEIVSADSRQVYRGIDIISGKDIDKKSEFIKRNKELGIEDPGFSVGFRKKDNIPVWLVDIVEPDYIFNVGDYSKLARAVIQDIWLRKKLPIVVGGTGLYIKSIVDPLESISIPPNKRLRDALNSLDALTLQDRLGKMDKSKLESMNHSDRNNPRRLIRAIEIADWKTNTANQHFIQRTITPDTVLFIGLKAPLKILNDRIDLRVDKRFESGAAGEIKQFMSADLSFSLPALTASGCRQLREYINGRENLQDALRSWKYQEHEYARRQITWFKKDKRVIWFDTADSHYPSSVEEHIRTWYTAKSN